MGTAMIDDVTTSLYDDTDGIENVTYDTSQNYTVTLPPDLANISLHSYVSFAVTLFFLAVGVFGNGLTTIIMARQKYIYNAHGLYLMALAIMDIKSLLVVTLNKPLLIEIFEIDIRAYTVEGCKLFKYIGRASVVCSSHFVVLICIERFIGIWFPLKAKFLLSKTKALISISAIFVTIYVVFIPTVVYTSVRDGICLPDFAMEPDELLPQIMIFLTWLMHTMIPTIVLIILTPLTVFQLYRQKLVRRQLGGQKREDVTSRISIMLISVVISYFFLICTFSIAFWVLTLSGINVLTSTSQWSLIFRDIYETAELMNYSFNFFLYVLTNADFRRQICQLFKSTGRRSIISALEFPSTSTKTTD